MDTELIYVYCISDCLPQFENISGDENPKCLKLHGLYAIVKNVSPEGFSEENLKKNFSDLAWIELHTRAHIRIICDIMKNSTVIPFKFGTIFNTEENLGNFIQDYSLSLIENLEHLKGKEEWSVKIYCDRAQLNQQIGTISEDLRNLDQEIMKSMPGKAFILKRKKAELIINEVDNVIRGFGQTCYDSLFAQSVSSRVNNLLPREITERTDDMVLNASFLLHHDKISGLLAIVEEMQEKFRNIGFHIDVVGPWPPFSFISLKEK